MLAYKFELNGEQHDLSVHARHPQLEITVNGKPHCVSEATAPGDDCAMLTIDGRSYQVWRCWESDRIHLRIGGQTFSVDYEDAITAAQHSAAGDDVLRADMPGVVVSIACAADDAVAGGDVLMVIESMKMQINIVAPRDGVIENIHLEPNQTFDKGVELITLLAQAD